MLTQERLKELLSYDKETGIFTWLLTSGKQCAGRQAGSIKSKEYIYIRIDGKLYVAHRLAWFMTYGVWPSGQIDHINRIKKDNRIVNLRDVSQTENQMNCGLHSQNTSGYKCVYFSIKHNKWRAYINVDKKLKHLGCFDTAELAVKARKDAVEKYYPQLGEIK